MCRWMLCDVFVRLNSAIEISALSLLQVQVSNPSALICTLELSAFRLLLQEIYFFKPFVGSRISYISVLYSEQNSCCDQSLRKGEWNFVRINQFFHRTRDAWDFVWNGQPFGCESEPTGRRWPFSCCADFATPVVCVSCAASHQIANLLLSRNGPPVCSSRRRHCRRIDCFSREVSRASHIVRQWFCGQLSQLEAVDSPHVNFDCSYKQFDTDYF